MSGTYTYSTVNLKQTVTIGSGGSYTITAVGGTGGSTNYANGGLGASVTDTFALPAGATITIIDGGAGF